MFSLDGAEQAADSKPDEMERGGIHDRQLERQIDRSVKITGSRLIGSEP